MEEMFPKVFQIGSNSGEIYYSINDSKKLSKYCLLASLGFGFFYLLLSRTKNANDPFYRGQKIKPPVWIHNFLNILLIAIFASLAYLGDKFNSIDIVLFFGGIAFIYVCSFLYFNIIKKK